MLISIITVVFNDKERIAQTMTSVLNQDYPDFEYIIVDGKSTDGTLQVVKSLMNEKVRIISENDNGIYDAMNKGIKLANGQIIGILNAGDFYEMGTLKLISKLDSDVITGHMHRINSKGEIVFTNYRNSTYLKTMYEAMPLNHPVTFVKKSIYEKYGAFSEEFKYCADNEFVIRIINSGVEIKFLDKVLGRMELGGISENFKTIHIMNREHFSIRSKYHINIWKNIRLSFKYILQQSVSRFKNGFKA